MERFVLIINDWKPLSFVKKYLYINVYVAPIYINVELLSNIDKTNISNKTKTTVTLCSKIVMFHQYCGFNPFEENLKIEFQTDGA